MITVPDALAALLLRDGGQTREWIDRFPELADHCLRQWQCEVEGPVATGAVAVIIPVRSSYGPAMVKISPPHPGNAHEHLALRAWGGHGAVRLYRSDDLSGSELSGYALLLERIEQRQLDVPADEGIVVGARLLRRLAVPAPAGAKQLAATTQEWEEQLKDDRRRSGNQLSDRAVGTALETIRDLGQDTTTTLLHGDLHGGNILHSARGWVAIDPKGMYGPRAFDSFTMCTYRWPFGTDIDPVAEARRRIAIFSEAAEADPELSLRCAQARAATGVLWDRARDGGRPVPDIDPRVALAETLLARTG